MEKSVGLKQFVPQTIGGVSVGSAEAVGSALREGSDVGLAETVGSAAQLAPPKAKAGNKSATIASWLMSNTFKLLDLGLDTTPSLTFLRENPFLYVT